MQKPENQKLQQKYVSAATIRSEIDVSAATLRLWAIAGKLDHIQLEKKKRLYNREEALRLLGVAPDQAATLPSTVQPTTIERQRRSKLIYARVSALHQKADLQEQIKMLQSAYPEYEVLSDIGSGLNWERKGLQTVLDRVYDGVVETVVVAYKDRLACFGCELLEWIFAKHDTELVVHNIGASHKTRYDELAKDLSYITTHLITGHNGGDKQKENICDRTAQSSIGQCKGGKNNHGHEEDTARSNNGTETVAEKIVGCSPLLL